MEQLLARIDIALKAIGMSRAELARRLGLSPQAISSLGRRSNARLKHENMVAAAAIMRCDLGWLSTGEGPYKPATEVVRLHGDLPRVFISHTVGADSAELEALLLAMFRMLPTDAHRAAIAYLAGLLAKHADPGNPQ